MNDDALEVMVAEYKSLRNEMYKIFDHQLRLLAIIGSFLGVFYGIIFSQEGLRDLILLIPLIIFPLGLRFQYQSYGVELLSKYLKDLEQNIKDRKTEELSNWKGYQNYWDQNHIKLFDFIYDASSKWLIFIVIPMSISILYSFIIIYPERFSWIMNELKINSILSEQTHMFLSWSYILLIVGSVAVPKIIKWHYSKKEGANMPTKTEKGLPFGLIFFAVFVLLAFAIPAFFVVGYKDRIIIGLIEQIFGVFLLSIYIISGGIVKWQSIEWPVFKRLVKIFGKTVQPGRTIYILFTSIGLGLIISGLLLELLAIIFL